MESCDNVTVGSAEDPHGSVDSASDGPESAALPGTIGEDPSLLSGSSPALGILTLPRLQEAEEGFWEEHCALGECSCNEPLVKSRL